VVVIVPIHVRIRDEQRQLRLTTRCNDQSRTRGCIAFRDHVALDLDQANLVWVCLKIGSQRRGSRARDGLLLGTGHDGRPHCEDMLVGVACETVSGVAQGMTVEAVDTSVACIYPRELVSLEGVQRTR
jgi:urease alpha subunit